MKLQKRPFDKTTSTKNTKTDFGLENEHEFILWRDPSRQVVMAVIETVTLNEDRLSKMTEQEKQELDDRFWDAVSRIFVDCDIEGLDFSSPAKAKQSFDSPNVDWNFLWEVLIHYVTDLVKENDKIGSFFRRSRT